MELSCFTKSRKQYISIIVYYYYISDVIKNFSCKDTEKVFLGNYTKKWDRSVRRKGQMKLDLLNAAMKLEELKSLPGNRLHQLKGEFSSYHSISINMQWWVIFIWKDGNAENVRIVDYH